MHNVKHLIGEVATRHGVRLDAGDPAFCLVTLNELALKEIAKELLEGVRGATTDFERSAENVQHRAGLILAQRINETLVELRHQFENDVSEASLQVTHRLEKVSEIHTKFAMHWMVAGLIAALVIFAFGVFVGARFL